jgi:hypothetical protein
MRGQAGAAFQNFTGNQAGLPVHPAQAAMVGGSVQQPGPMWPALHPAAIPGLDTTGQPLNPAYLHQNPSGPISPNYAIPDGPLPGTMLQGLMAGLTPRELAVLVAKLQPDPLIFISTPRNYLLGG